MSSHRMLGPMKHRLEMLRNKVNPSALILYVVDFSPITLMQGRMSSTESLAVSRSAIMD